MRNLEFRPFQYSAGPNKPCALGRGIASVPAGMINASIFGQALTRLATDAVISAADSPFLDGLIANSSHAWCNLKIIGPTGTS